MYEYYCFRARKEFSSGIFEGLNVKAKVATRKAYGFKRFETLELALYHLGALPEAVVTLKRQVLDGFSYRLYGSGGGHC